MARIVLVHGSWQGAWCWREIVPRLAARGHDAVAIDLPGHGEDRTSPETVTLPDYARHIAAEIEAGKGTAILVGHSMGVIRQAAELIPEGLRALVYVAGLVPANGARLLDLVAGFDPEYLSQLVWAADRRTARISTEGATKFLYSECPAEAVAYALPLLRPEPVAPYETPFALAEEKPGAAPQFYVECLRDRVVPIGLQKAIAGTLAPGRTYSLDTGHAPFFSTPDDLTSILDEIAGRV